MANFIIRFLEFNKEKTREIKGMVFNDELLGNKWAFDNLGILVLVCEVILLSVVALVSLLKIPVGMVMISINAIYSLFKLIVGHTYWNKFYIRKSLNDYETSLNKRNSYFLCDKQRGGDWTCVVLDPNMEDFIAKFFKNLNATYDTYEMNSNKLICRRHKKRSIGDTYLVCKNYYPEATLDDVIKCLIRLINSEIIAVSKCSEINKYVFVKKDSYINNYRTKDLEFIKGINFEQLTKYYERNGGLS